MFASQEMKKEAGSLLLLSEIEDLLFSKLPRISNNGTDTVIDFEWPARATTTEGAGD